MRDEFQKFRKSIVYKSTKPHLFIYSKTFGEPTQQKKMGNQQPNGKKRSTSVNRPARKRSQQSNKKGHKKSVTSRPARKRSGQTAKKMAKKNQVQTTNAEGTTSNFVNDQNGVGLPTVQQKTIEECQ